MPTAIGGFIGWVVGAAFEGLVAFGLSEAAAIFVVDIGIKMAGLALLGTLANKLIDIPDLAQTAASNLLTTRGTLEHQRILYGEVLVSGPLWYMNAAGTHNQSLYHAVVVAGHEIEDITDVWLDDNVIPSAAIDWAGDGSVDSGDFRGNLSEQTTTYFDKFLGTSVQTASPDLMSAFTEITSQHQGRGISWFLTRTDFFENQTHVWSQGAPKNYRALCLGKKVYNPTSDSTQAWGTGPHRVDDDSTWEYSNNPALVWADYMIDKKLGFGEDPARIRYNYVASAAAINSGHVATPNSESTQRFTCNGALSTGVSYADNLKSILSSGNMTMALVQGQWVLRPWAYETPALSFGDDDLRGDIQISLSTEESRRYNTVRGPFIDKARLWQAHPFPAFTSSEYVARDNSETLIKDIQLPMTTDTFMAQRLGAGILEQSDLQRTVIYPSNFKTLPVEIGGTIKLSNAKMGWDEETFRVTNYKFSDMKGIDLVLQEDTSAAYTDVGTDEYAVLTGGVYSTAAPGVPAPTSLNVQNVPEGVRLTWNNPPARLHEWTEVWRSTQNSFGSAAAELVNLSRINYFVDQPVQNQLYYYWIRSQNFASEVSSPVPDINSGDIGVWTHEPPVINYDSQFEQSKEGHGDDTFWTGINSWSGGSGFGSKGFSKIVSDSLGTGETQVLRNSMVTNPGSGFQVHNVFNNKVSPVLRGAGINVNARYLVHSFSNVTSHYFDMTLIGQKSLHQIGGGTELWNSRLWLPNTDTWQIYSDYLQVNSWSNIQSYAYVGCKIEQWNWNTTAEVDTGYIMVDFDWATWRWRDP